MRTLNIRDIIIGEGRPKICVPILGSSELEIMDGAQAAGNCGADMAEFRCDFLENADDPEHLSAILKSVRERIGNMPLLFTFRTAAEGGAREVSDEHYIKICANAIESGYIDLLDIELGIYERINTGSKAKGRISKPDASGEDVKNNLIIMARRNNIFVVMSNHDFHDTPEEEEISGRLFRMEELGADILKIAVMPRGRADVMKLLSATVRVSETSDRPLITMAMGSDGVISRIIGEFTGSSVTFASAGQASAPGQIDVRNMKRILEALDTALS